jgi:hypothetical protein
MSFAAPWMLLGLVAAIIPIWIHLRSRRMGAVPFPAASILFKVAKRHRKRLQLRTLFLLVLRILIIAAVVLAVSRPGVTVWRPGGIRTGPALAMVIVLDDSLSMRMKGPDGKTVFDKAKDSALTEIDRLRPGDAVSLILSGSPVRIPVPELEFDLDRARRVVEASSPSYFSGDIEEALKAALHIAQESPMSQQEVVVITDLRDGSWEKHRPPWTEKLGIGLRVVDAGADVSQATNAAVDQILTSPSPEGIAREALIEARIVNYSGKALRNFEVILEVEGEEVARGSLDVPPNSSAIKRFFHRFEKDGVYRGLVRIKPDGLEEDDVRHFSLFASESITAFVINGDYHPGSYRDEAFYLQKALETPMPGEAPITPLVVDVDTALARPLSSNDVVFLAGVSELDASLASRLVDYVRRGGGVFISSGSTGVKLDLIRSILPAKIRSIRQAPQAARLFRIASVDKDHPMFETFSNGPTGLEQTQIRKHLLLEPEPSADRNTLIEMTDGVPLLIERRVGDGKVMLLTTTIDRDWSDLPIRPGFLPLVQRAARYLAGRLDERGPRRITAGRPVRIEVSRGMQRLLVRGPGEKDTTFPAVELADRSSIEFKGADEPGHYQVWAEIPGFGGLHELPALGFVVETDPAESNPARVIAPSGENETDRFAPVRGSLPMWPYLLIAVVLLLLAETWLSGQGLRRSHKSKPA